MVRRVLASIDSISEWTGKITSFLIPIMMAVMTYEVVARYVFNKPTIWAMETTQYLFLTSTALGGAWLLLHQGHVNVSILHDRLGIRTRAVVDVLTSFFFFAFVFFLLQHTLGTTIEAVKYLQHSASYWEPPVYPVYILMTVGIVFIFIQGLVKLIRDFTTALAGKAEVEMLDEEIK